MLAEGRIGRLVSVRAMVGEPLPQIRPDYRDLYLAKQGGAFELMHDIDLALWYAGQELKTVHGLNGAFSDIGIQAPDVVELLMEFHNRCIANVHLDFFQQPRRRQLDLMGTEGTITIEFSRWDQCTISHYDVTAKNWVSQTLITDRDDMFRDEDRQFLQAVAGDLPIQCTLEEGLKSLKVVLASQKKC